MNAAALLVTISHTIEIIDLGDALLILEMKEIAIDFETYTVNEGSEPGTPMSALMGPSLPLLAAAC